MNRVALVSMCVVVSMLAACASTAPMQPASAGPQVSDDGTCHAERVAWAVGKQGDEQTMKAVWKQSGAGLIRPIAPGQAVTRDFRQDRVNVHIDSGNAITKVDCG
jgi:formate-dependent nitrite reductase cytochrome c552 subunit